MSKRRDHFASSTTENLSGMARREEKNALVREESSRCSWSFHKILLERSITFLQIRKIVAIKRFDVEAIVIPKQNYAELNVQPLNVNNFIIRPGTNNESSVFSWWIFVKREEKRRQQQQQKDLRKWSLAWAENFRHRQLSGSIRSRNSPRWWRVNLMVECGNAVRLDLIEFDYYSDIWTFKSDTQDISQSNTLNEDRTFKASFRWNVRERKKHFFNSLLSATFD